ncbi:hypothetical protein ABPG74_004785 [Tetrahymena malaccensis]
MLLVLAMTMKNRKYVYLTQIKNKQDIRTNQRNFEKDNIMSVSFQKFKHSFLAQKLKKQFNDLSSDQNQSLFIDSSKQCKTSDESLKLQNQFSGMQKNNLFYIQRHRTLSVQKQKRSFSVQNSKKAYQNNQSFSQNEQQQSQINSYSFSKNQQKDYDFTQTETKEYI